MSFFSLIKILISRCTFVIRRLPSFTFLCFHCGQLVCCTWHCCLPCVAHQAHPLRMTSYFRPAPCPCGPSPEFSVEAQVAHQPLCPSHCRSPIVVWLEGETHFIRTFYKRKRHSVSTRFRFRFWTLENNCEPTRERVVTLLFAGIILYVRHEQILIEHASLSWAIRSSVALLFLLLFLLVILVMHPPARW